MCIGKRNKELIFHAVCDNNESKKAKYYNTIFRDTGSRNMQFEVSKLIVMIVLKSIL